MNDYKDRIQAKAEEMAQKGFDLDFYDLPEAVQSDIYKAATFLVAEDMRCRADEQRKARREQ